MPLAGPLLRGAAGVFSVACARSGSLSRRGREAHHHRTAGQRVAGKGSPLPSRFDHERPALSARAIAAAWQRGGDAIGRDDLCWRTGIRKVHIGGRVPSLRIPGVER